MLKISLERTEMNIQKNHKSQTEICTNILGSFDFEATECSNETRRLKFCSIKIFQTKTNCGVYASLLV